MAGVSSASGKNLGSKRQGDDLAARAVPGNVTDSSGGVDATDLKIRFDLANLETRCNLDVPHKQTRQIVHQTLAANNDASRSG